MSNPSDGKHIYAVIERHLKRGRPSAEDYAARREIIEKDLRHAAIVTLGELIDDLHETATQGSKLFEKAHATAIADHFGGIAPLALHKQGGGQNPIDLDLILPGSVPLPIAIALMAGIGIDDQPFARIRHHWTDNQDRLSGVATIFHCSPTNSQTASQASSSNMGPPAPQVLASSYVDDLIATLEDILDWFKHIPLIHRFSSLIQIEKEAKLVSDALQRWLDSLIATALGEIHLTPLAHATGAAVAETQSQHQFHTWPHINLDAIANDQSIDRLSNPGRQAALTMIGIALRGCNPDQHADPRVPVRLSIIKTESRGPIDSQQGKIKDRVGYAYHSACLPLEVLHFYERDELVIEQDQSFISDNIPAAISASLIGTNLATMIENPIISGLSLVVTTSKYKRVENSQRTSWINIERIMAPILNDPDIDFECDPSLRLKLEPRPPYTLVISPMDAQFLITQYLSQPS